MWLPLYLILMYRMGTEHEKFGFYRDTLQPINYETIAKLLNRLAERFGWEKIMEGENVIGLQMVSRGGVNSSDIH